jgi:hypothetical protein
VNELIVLLGDTQLGMHTSKLETNRGLPDSYRIADENPFTPTIVPRMNVPQKAYNQFFGFEIVLKNRDRDVWFVFVHTLAAIAREAISISKTKIK